MTICFQGQDTEAYRAARQLSPAALLAANVVLEAALGAAVPAAGLAYLLRLVLSVEAGERARLELEAKSVTAAVEGRAEEGGGGPRSAAFVRVAAFALASHVLDCALVAASAAAAGFGVGLGLTFPTVVASARLVNESSRLFFPSIQKKLLTIWISGCVGTRLPCFSTWREKNGENGIGRSPCLGLQDNMSKFHQGKKMVSFL